MAKALSHPLRSRILIRLNETVASPNELAQYLGESLGTVAYHVRVLADLDCVELVETAQRRGAVEHYYRAIQRAIADDSTWAQLPPSTRRGLAVEWFKATFGDVTGAIDAGHFEARSDTHLSFTTLALDEQGWNELSERLQELLDEALGLEAEAAERKRVGDSGEEIFARLVLAQYEGVPRASRATSRKPKRSK